MIRKIKRNIARANMRAAGFRKIHRGFAHDWRDYLYPVKSKHKRRKRA